MKKNRQNLNTQTLEIWWRHTRKYWGWLILSGSGIILLIIGVMGSPLMYKKLLDILADNPTRTLRQGIDHQVYVRIGHIISMSFMGWIGWRLCTFGVIKFESKVMADLTNYCFEYLHGHSYRFFSDNFAGSLLKRVNRFSLAFEVIADQCILQLGQTIIRILLIIAVLFWVNIQIGTLFLAWTLLFIAFNFFSGRYKLKLDLERAKLDTEVTARLADTISNSINLKLFAGNERELQRFNALTDRHRNARYKSWLVGEYLNSIQGFSTRILELTVLVLAYRYWSRGILTIGTFILLKSYLTELIDRVQDIGKSVQRIYEAMADANEMTEILTTPHEVSDSVSATALGVTNGEIVFHNVEFCYPGNPKHVLHNFNLRIRPGELIGIVGLSGGGKSTILKLLTRLYDINSGTITIDGQNIAQVTQDSLHRNIAYVPQDPILFHRTLMENIRYSKPEATDDQVMEASRLAHCHEFISRFPDGYNTLVGERGIKLSGGERQRVAIARAILANAPILILDEATSSLDSQSEMYIQDSLSYLMAGRSVIAIAHRLSTIRRMNRIVVIDDGEIMEQGSHDLLLRIEDGMYQKLWGLQSSETYVEEEVS